MAEALNEEMVASYSVAITGIERTRAELKRLDGAIALLRKTNYSPAVPTVTVAGNLGGRDIFSSKVDDLEGRVQAGAQRAMASSMALGRRTQTEALRAAVTETGISGKPKGRKGPGREVTGSMIQGIATNVETYKDSTSTTVTGWHGWPTEGRKHFEFQERGTKGRGGASKAYALKVGSVYRAPNKKSRKAAGQRTQLNNRGVPAANSLGQSIVVVREHLKKELAGLKR